MPHIVLHNEVSSVSQSVRRREKQEGLKLTSDSHCIHSTSNKCETLKQRPCVSFAWSHLENQERGRKNRWKLWTLSRSEEENLKLCDANEKMKSPEIRVIFPSHPRHSWKSWYTKIIWPVWAGFRGAAAVFSLAAQYSRGANADTQIDHLTWQHPAFKSDSWSELVQHKQSRNRFKNNTGNNRDC